VVIWSIAAVAWDTANASVKTGSAAGTADEHRTHCNLAIEMIDAEIVALIQTSTIFTFATSYSEIMGRYVYLRRALQGRTSIDKVHIVCDGQHVAFLHVLCTILTGAACPITVQ